VKALSLTQPWCGAILHLGKRIENRQRWKGCAYRGPVLLHAAKGIGTRDDFNDTVEAILDALNPDAGPARLEVLRQLGAEVQIGGRGRHHAEGSFVPSSHMPRMGVVGIAMIDNVIRTETDARRAEVDTIAREPFAGPQMRWWMGGFALLLKDVRPLPFLPWKGALGLFEIPDNVAKPLIARSTFTTGQFVSIGAATPAEVAAAINGSLIGGKGFV
jgi:hypothetical protein